LFLKRFMLSLYRMNGIVDDKLHEASMNGGVSLVHTKKLMPATARWFHRRSMMHE